MGLKDRYAQMTGAAPASPAAAPSAAPSTATVSEAASPGASSSLPAAASAATTTPAPATTAAPTPGAGRDLAAVRARLAQRTSPGVNPPEATIPPAAFDRTTKEGPEGEAIPLENHQDVLKAAAKAAVAGHVVSSPSTGGATAGELTRGQKAAATRAANKAAASTGAPAAAAPPSEPAPALFLLPNAHDRIAKALERIADALEAANAQ